AIKELCEFQEEIIAEIGEPKMDVELILPAEDLATEIEAVYNERMKEAIQIFDKQERAEAIDAVKEGISEAYEIKYEDADISESELQSLLNDVKEVANTLEKNEV